MSNDKKGKYCPNCGDKFGWAEFSSYFAKFKSLKVFCLTCQNESSFQDDWDVKKILLVAYAMGIGLIIFMALYALLNIEPEALYQSERRGSKIVLIICTAIAYAAYVFIWKVFMWLFLPLTFETEIVPKTRNNR